MRIKNDYFTANRIQILLRKKHMKNLQMRTSQVQRDESEDSSSSPSPHQLAECPPRNEEGF